MCEYVSWIEKDGKLLYLSDDDVYSSHGRKKLSGLQDNDAIGHGAIRAYYGLARYEGTDHERTDWWARDLPDEIKSHVRSGRCVKILREGLCWDGLDHIARNAPVWALNMVAKTGLLTTRREKGHRYTETIGYRRDGSVSWRNRYKDGKLHGESIGYFPDGSVWRRRRYKGGVLAS